MKKLLIAVLALVLTACGTMLPSNKFMTQIAAMKSNDLQAAAAISGNVANPDQFGSQCVMRILMDKPIIDQVFNAPHPGPFSTIAYFRSIDLLAERLWPALERDCGPVLMDIRTRVLHVGLLFGH